MNALLRFLRKILGAPRACPHCGAPEAGSPFEPEELDASIEAGMTIVCLRCAGLILVGPGLAFREPTPEDMERLWRSPRASIVRREQRAVRRKLDRDARREGGGAWS